MMGNGKIQEEIIRRKFLHLNVMRSTIIIHRTSQFANRFRKIEIFINHQKVGDVKNGETVKFSVLSGEISLVAKIDWCGSNTINCILKENETKEFRLKGTSPLFAFVKVIAEPNGYLELFPV